MKTLGPHTLTVVTSVGELPLELWFELDEPTLNREVEIYMFEGRFRYECDLFSGTKRVVQTGEIALLATLMRIAATHLRLDQEIFGVEMYCSIPGDLSTDWSFYTFGEDAREFVDPNSLTPPET